ncbi:MAG: penicillin-binding protein 1C, partial [Alphaproteobacteria bacterium]|nr:penicillin-binding protein 1C [Alphaproteobacteria bacterium]
HQIGINPISIFRATGQYISHTPHPAGASTITMQVAKLKYNINTKNITGKLKQIAAAIYIDLFYSKSEILTTYLNLAPYGANIEGIGAAALVYFGKPASKLTKIEAITLATIPQNPNKRSLNTASGLKNIVQMRKDLVRRWIKKYPNDTNLISLAEMPLQTNNTGNLPFLAPHFIDNLNTMDFRPAPKINTSLDAELQGKMEHTLRTEVSNRRAHGIKNSAAILLNYKTMEVLSYIGSADYHNAEIYGENDGVRAKRSPGSTLKPLIYATATDTGLIHPMTLLKDTKVNFGVYAPENSDNEFYGPVLARDALTHSRNIPAINLVREIGVKKFHKLLLDSGVSNLKDKNHYGVSVALGGAEVSMFELADIYATMANLGHRRKIKTILTDSDKTLGHLLSPEAFFLTLDMLSHNPVPNRKIPFAKTNSRPLIHYWKTGTSSSYRDAWTAGIFGDFVLIVWVGNFDGTPNNSFSGAKTAAPIYFSLANTVANYYSSKGTPIQNNNFMPPDLNVIKIDMCNIGGGIAGTYCPEKISSYFIPGKSPITRNTVHRQIPIDNKTHLRACDTNPDTTHFEVFEFWDAEYLDMFRRAGIKRKTPPKFMPGCNISEKQAEFSEPIIISPTPDTSIIITSNLDTQPVVFMGLASDDNAKLFWFLDDKALGSTKSGEIINYNVATGKHKLNLTDSNGNATATEFNVIK